MMTFPNNHKTVVILDHGPNFLASSRECIEFDIFAKSRGPGLIPLAPITKTIWTCSVEAAIEYCRIVYDIYPSKKLICFVSSDIDTVTLNTWAAQQQSTQQLMMSLAQLGPPSTDLDGSECGVLPGLNQAVQLLCEPTTTQQEVQATDLELKNRGRILCLTSLKSEEHIKDLEDIVHQTILQQNKIAAVSDNLLPIDHCELVLLHIVPVGEDSDIAETPMKTVSPLLSSQVHVTQSGKYTAIKLVQMAQQHYHLSSTTVTGIPMKEEQNASSSANYDVELLHPWDAHEHLIASGVVDSILVPSKEGITTDTVTLKWCTPKTNAVELQQCTGAYRLSPVDVNSRPSSCLTNFLLSGRAVMLEQPKKSGGKVISHMLASHGGEIYIHTLSTVRSILEDAPSISEGCGGRVTDYRIPDFGELMKECRLAPASEAIISEHTELPVERAKSHMERVTRYWPVVISDTIIFNMLSHLDPLPSLIVKESLDDDSVLECKKAIYHIVSIESRNDPLPVSMAGSRGKGPKRDEQYRQMWAELETLIRAHADTSPQHRSILDCLLDCKRPQEDGKGSKKIKEEKSEVMDSDSSWKLAEKKGAERDRADTIKNEKAFVEAPPVKRMKSTTIQNFNGKSSNQSLLSMWTSCISSVHQRHAEFSGRLESSGKTVELYQHLKEEKSELTESVSNTVAGKLKS